MIDRDDPHVSVRRQFELLRVSRSGLYYVPLASTWPSAIGA